MPDGRLRADRIPLFRPLIRDCLTDDNVYLIVDTFEGGW